MKLKNATALVSGGSNGIGFAIAQMLVHAGARVAITGRHEARLREAAKRLDAFGVCADVSKEADVERTYSEILQEFGHLDILINNAGFGVFNNLTDLSLDEFESIFATNVTGAMLMGRAAARHFITRNHGNIINIGSTSALHGAPGGTAYYASKFALRGMTECWRAELRKHNIRVILVNPSEVISSFADVAGFKQKKDNPSKLRPEDIAHAVKSVLEMDDRGFTTELTIFATNPLD